MCKDDRQRWSVVSAKVRPSHSFDRYAASLVCTSRTNSHDHQKPRQEPSQFDDAIAPTVHEVLVCLCLPAYPVGQRRDYVGCDNEQGEVGLEEGRGEDDQEESNGQYLLYCQHSARMRRRAAAAQHTKESTMMVLSPAMAMAAEVHGG